VAEGPIARLIEIRPPGERAIVSTPAERYGTRFNERRPDRSMREPGWP